MQQQETVDSILYSTKTHWPEAYKTITPAILRLIRTHYHIDVVLNNVQQKYQLQGAEFGILTTLRRSGAPYCLSPTALYHSLLFSSGGLTKVLNRVEKAGLITRVDNPDDKRSKLVKLTPKGKVLIEKLVVELHQKEQQKMAILTLDEQQQLEGLLKKLLKSW
ncbi:MarR family winged helix-turn-helix transcriptional regulator [Shewanella intestini]|uniref:MarR family transcriptional regulator n=1 Tax=Shewanella intestini TaxID=2017544 RepID=A0ABS5I4C5_9GAMM|nr:MULTISPECIES: MarR family transcriptional regulator [Shewanella]MBR9728878.1 MarR family transcriptional regulator [Shewanella intestini]MRG37056.1 MarR family transcriptional regulator [Shewanella sp. XMDDZSB0408]